MIIHTQTLSTYQEWLDAAERHFRAYAGFGFNCIPSECNTVDLPLWYREGLTAIEAADNLMWTLF